MKPVLRLYRHFRPFRALIRWSRRYKLKFADGVSLYNVSLFFIRNLDEEPLALRASSIAFNLFLALFPALIALFTLLPFVPIHDLNRYILFFMQKLMPATAFSSLDEVLRGILDARAESSLLSVGLIASFYFASNGIFSLMAGLNRDDPRSFWRQRAVSLGLTIALGLVVIGVLSLFLLTQFLIELLAISTSLNTDILYYLLVLVQWSMMAAMIFATIVILYRHGSSQATRWRYIVPGAVLASLLMLITSIAYSYYVGRWANYNRIYGSLGAMIITMLWLYFNSMVLIIGHDFNKSLLRARLAMKSAVSRTQGA